MLAFIKFIMRSIKSKNNKTIKQQCDDDKLFQEYQRLSKKRNYYKNLDSNDLREIHVDKGGFFSSDRYYFKTDHVILLDRLERKQNYGKQ